MKCYLGFALKARDRACFYPKYGSRKVFQLHKKNALFTYEVDFDGHDVGKMLSVGGGEVEGAPDHGQAAQVTLSAQDARRLVQVETAVRVTRHDPGMRKTCVTMKRLNVDLMNALESTKLYT
jgi:hypothetical protein